MDIVFSLTGIAFIVITIFTKHKTKVFFDHTKPAEGTIINMGISQTKALTIK